MPKPPWPSSSGWPPGPLVREMALRGSEIQQGSDAWHAVHTSDTAAVAQLWCQMILRARLC